MDLTALPFDAHEMLARLRPWILCESPTHDVAAVNRMMDLAAWEVAASGAAIERIPGRMGFGDCLRARFPHPKAGGPGVLVMAHLDTVHPIGTLADLPFREKDGRCWGPGIWDMKGGTFAALEAIRTLATLGLESPLPVTLLLTSDEEVGSPSTRDLIEAEARRHRYVLVPEPATPDRGVITGRYAIARFRLLAEGRPSHAGAALSEGRSAIREMAKQIVAIEEMTTPDCTFSVGIVHGGQWVNCVATTCTGEALSMAKRQADLDAGVARMLALQPTTPETRFTVTRSVTRPVWEPNGACLGLYETARQIAGHLGLDLPHHSAGGGSDANFTGALGIASLDGLGLVGGFGHTLNEQIEIASLAERARLMAGLLLELR
ncbi:M20/M25/M40 family metallo-hydrolase [Acidisoma sp. 7E03]